MQFGHPQGVKKSLFSPSSFGSCGGHLGMPKWQWKWLKRHDTTGAHPGRLFGDVVDSNLSLQAILGPPFRPKRLFLVKDDLLDAQKAWKCVNRAIWNLFTPKRTWWRLPRYPKQLKQTFWQINQFKYLVLFAPQLIPPVFYAVSTILKCLSHHSCFAAWFGWF